MLHSAIPEELIEKYSETAFVTATNVFNSVIAAQSNIINISQVDVDDNKTINISPKSKSTSIIISEIVDCNIIIHDKVNHVLIRKCENVSIDLLNGTISGIDLLYCRRMGVRMSLHNFTNVEYGEKITFLADVDEISELHVMGSVDIKVNGDYLPINPFKNVIFRKSGWEHKGVMSIPDVTLANY